MRKDEGRRDNAKTERRSAWQWKSCDGYLGRQCDGTSCFSAYLLLFSPGKLRILLPLCTASSRGAVDARSQCCVEGIGSGGFSALWLRGIFSAASTAVVPLVMRRGLCWELQEFGQAAKLFAEAVRKGKL